MKFNPAMERAQTLVWIALSLQVVVVTSSNLRVQGAPDYMKAGGIKSKEAKRQVLGIEKGEFLAALFNNCTVVYNDSQHTEMTVRVKANLKVQDAETQAQIYEKKI